MYDRIAAYYDLIHAELTADIGFVLTLAAHNPGPILELGCGTGRLLLPLARAGHTVTGLDNSSAMLRRAESRLAAEAAVVRERVTLLSGEMGEITFDGDFTLVIVPYNTLMHLEPTAAQRVIGRISRALRPGGRLFLDLANPLACAQTPDDRVLTLERVMTEPESGRTIVQLAGSWADQATQTLHVTWLFDSVPPGGGPLERTVAEMVYHYLYPHELALYLEMAGLVLEGFYGDYTQRPFTEESERLLALATLPIT